MSDTKDRWKKILDPYIVSGPNAKGEYRARCPIHKERNASSSFNFDKGVYHCKAGCNGGQLSFLVRYVKRQAADDKAGVADYNPFENTVIDFEAKRSAKAATNGKEKVPLTEAKVLGFHQALMDNDDVLDWLLEHRGLTEEVVERYQLGWERATGRYTIPVRDAEGQLVNLRRYKRDADGSLKMINWLGYGTPPRLFPVDQLHNDDILVVEGELDALVCIAHGVPAVSGTHGSEYWDRQWSKLMEDKNVYISYDNDKGGRTGAKKASHSLAPLAAKVAVLEPLMKEHKSDVTDWFVRGGGTAAKLRALMAAAAEAVPETVPVPTVASVQVIGSMDSRTNGKPLHMDVTVTGKKNPTYSVPRVVDAQCTMDAGTKCKVCPMYLEHEGDYHFELPTSGPDIAKRLSAFIDASDSRRMDLLRQEIGTPKCAVLELDVKDSTSVEEIFVASSMDNRNGEGVDYTQRRVYNFGEYSTPTNTVASLVGTTWPSPRDSRNEFYSWDLKEAQTSIDTFNMTPEVYKRLRKFQTLRGQSPIDKCRDIAHDLSDNVTRIYGRDRMHIAMDLVYHSVLQFPLDGKVLTRGWLEFIVVGDTRTGKSETAIRLADYYGLGHVIGCEGATFAGLVGAVKQVANEWTIQWGEVTLNDRRLAVLDEASGLSQELISQLSDIRSRGVAQLTKVESQQTRARTRLIWISNARKGKGVDEKFVDGIDILESLIGNPEDIARFDFAMSVRTDDVPMGDINNPDQAMGEPFYDAESCRDLILWAWSRKSDHVQWTEDSYRLIYKAADWLGGRYIPSPPLVQGTNVREKIARVAVALAARTFSTDATGEQVIVKDEHVRDAANFLDKLYSYENFGYRRLSERIFRNRKIASENKEKMRKWLMENPRLLEFLLDRRGSFRAQDLEEMAYMAREEVNHVLGKLSDAKMIMKDKSQIVMEPELQSLLKEIR